jgi:MarC family membrane protein
MLPRMTALALRSFLTMLVVVDPVGLVPMFLALAADRSSIERRRLAKRAVFTAGGILVAFALGGSWLLHRLGISLGAFQVAGGVLLLWIAVRMVFAEHQRETAAEEAEARGRADISVFPLAIPIIAGPGSMASIMILVGEAHPIPQGLLAVLATTGLVLALCYVALRLSEPLVKLLGQTGVNVVTRVLGMLLAALAVQYVADGARILIRTP